MPKDFMVFREIDNIITTQNYVLHNHNSTHEILLFLSGDAEFLVEGFLYKLKPYDLVIAGNNELHKMVLHSDKKYERIVIHLTADFFVKYNCGKFSEIFRQNGLNYIDAKTVLNTGIYENIVKIHKYYEESQLEVSKCVLVELLYLLNKNITHSTIHCYNSKHIQDIVAYINDNLSEDINLNYLANHFHLSASHISRIFKEHIRMSVKKYITYKRLLYAKELCLNGKTLLEASLEAGFSNYSNFYRMYVNEYGTSPKNGLKE